MRGTKVGSQQKSLDPDQIARIIEASALHGVTLLKFGDLEIWFGPHVKPGTTPAHPSAEVPNVETPIHTPVAEMTEKQHDDANAKAIEQNEIDLREQQIAELLITDPEEAEKLIRQGELQDADDESGDE